jgi:NTE family protein
MFLRRVVSSFLVCLCVYGFAPPVSASPQEEPAPASPVPASRPKIGLALGGGGARGAAHIGVIRVLEELHIPIDYVAGTSMGSIIGGLYSCGYTPDQMEKLIGSIHWDTLFQDAPERKDQSFRQKEDDFEHLMPFEFGLNFKKGGLLLPPGLIAGSKLGYVLETATLPCSSVTNFDQLRIPFRAVATDIQTGMPYVMGKGNLAKVIRASMAIPAIFTPVEIDGHLLVDGGEAQNLPVQTVQAMGADIVIAVNVGSSGAESAAKPTTVGGMIGRLIDLPLQQNTMASAKLANVVITPNLEGYTSADFMKALKMIPLGYQAAIAQKDKLSQWSAPESVYGPWLKRHDETLPPAPTIDEVVIDPVPGMDPRRLQYLVHSKPGPLDTTVLGQDLKRIYSIGAFEIVSYQIVEDGNRHILKITATPKSWGPDYLKLGLFLATDFQNTTQFGVTALYEATEMNSLGGEWKTKATIGQPLDLESRFYQPLSYRGHLFLSPFAGWQQQTGDVFLDQVALGTYQVSRAAVGADLGYDFGTWGELRVGYARAWGKGRRKVGSPDFPNLDWDEGGLTARLRVDQLDNVNLPHSGFFMDADYIGNRTGLGATASYDQFLGEGVGVQTIGRWTGLAKFEGGTGLGSLIPFYDQYRLGGLFRLSGRPEGQLFGNTYGLGALLLYYRLTDTEGAIVKNLSLGVSAEAGNTWGYQAPVSWAGMKHAGSVYVIADTLIGPFFIGYGRSGSKNNSAYLYLNRSF